MPPHQTTGTKVNLAKRQKPLQRLRNDEGLTRRQVEFVEAYMQDPDRAMAAARRMDGGNDPLMAQPGTIIALARRQAGIDIQPQEIVDNIVRISEKAEAAGLYMAALKGQELLGKYKGMWIEKHVNVNIDMARQHVDALVAKMKARREKGEYVPIGTEILDIKPSEGPFVMDDPFEGFTGTGHLGRLTAPHDWTKTMERRRLRQQHSSGGDP